MQYIVAHIILDSVLYIVVNSMSIIVCVLLYESVTGLWDHGFMGKLQAAAVYILPGAR